MKKVIFFLILSGLCGNLRADLEDLALQEKLYNLEKESADESYEFWLGVAQRKYPDDPHSAKLYALEQYRKFIQLRSFAKTHKKELDQVLKNFNEQQK